MKKQCLSKITLIVSVYLERRLQSTKFNHRIQLDQLVEQLVYAV